MNEIIKIAIVDDHPIVIGGLVSMLSKNKNFKIEATFTNGTDFLNFLKENKVNLVLLDIFLPDSNGIDLCKTIKKQYPKIIVLGMSSQSERSIVLQMIQNGANGYLLKSSNLNEFQNCIIKAIEGEIVFSDAVKTIISKPEASDLRTIPRLTNKEKQIVVLLSDGKSTQEIADILFLSHFTVQTHRRNLLQKLQVKNVAELIQFSIKNGMI